MLALIMVRFMPATLFILREEKVPPMKVKAAINLTFFVSYSFYNVGSIIFNIEMLARNPNGLVNESLLRPIAYVCFCLFIVMYVPHKWLLFLFYPRRFYTYYRLRRLDTSISQILYDTKAPIRVHVRPLLPGELELAIYRTTISILDRYPLIGSHTRGRDLYQRIRQLLAGEPPYADLVTGLMSIR